MRNDHSTLILSHADFRHEDYVFARTQSRALQAAEWVKTEPPLRSWSDMLLPAVSVAAALLAVAEIVH